MKNILKVLCCASVIALTLQAVDVPTRGPISFQAHDTNKDGFISKEEFDATKAARMDAKEEVGMPRRNAVNSPDFSYFDTNKDGKISQEELEKGQRRQPQGRGNQQ